MRKMLFERSDGKSIVRRVLQDCTRSLARRLPVEWQSHWNRWHEIVRYIFAGGANAILTYGVYVICITVMTYREAYTISFGCGIVFSYCVTTRFVFKENMRLITALQYLLVYLLQYCVGLGSLFLLVDVIHLSKLVAPLLTLFVTVPITFLLGRYVLKRRSGVV